MRRNMVPAVFFVTLFLFVVGLSIAHAQLIISDKDMRVVKVDPSKMRIEIASVSASDPNNTTGYIYINHATRTYDAKGAPYNWTNIKKGWIIRVKGGVRFDMNVNAKKIWVVKKGS